MPRPYQAMYDLAIVGGGINGAGIARDAAGRGLSTLLVEKDDLASHTSSWSTKLIHGGLRYLEYYEFRLVAESLAEREVLLRAAPHIITPLQFVLPHEPHLRPAWMIRAGLFLYDHLGGRKTLPSSFGVELSTSKWGAGLKNTFHRGFVYADARVDDSRLVVFNAISAREKGADIRTHTKLIAGRRENGHWRMTLQEANGETQEVSARALVNAAGPWVKQVQDEVSAEPAQARVRHVKGSHIVVPRIHQEEHAYILQNSDNRIVFVIPYQDQFSLIGTTDIPVEEYERPEISSEEIAYLCATASAYLARPIAPGDVVWTYSGVRPLYDDGSTDPAAVTRDYVLKLDADDIAPLLSIFGGKITTYRRLAEQALSELAPFFPEMKRPWTKTEPLPGGDMVRGDLAAYERELNARYASLDPRLLRALARRHGTRSPRVLGNATVVADLGRHFGDTLFAAEIEYLIAQEWATGGEDILWRRTKCGLHMTPGEREAVSHYLRERPGGVPLPTP
ncbi:MAG TPA: glycerol-3-phosphate dehydrogenase [Casimicrobiaceae bacterium]|nr:glycerol-3-phosphate dehydrogenase [Casimicrobiaceae bacterium]